MLDKNLIAKLDRIKEEYNGIQKDLTFEEVLLDKKLTMSLQKRSRKLLPIIQKYDEIEQIDSQMEGLSSEEKNLFEKEIDENCKKLKFLEEEVLFLLSSLDAEDESVTVEVTSKDDCCMLFEDIKTAYQNFVKKHNFVCNITQNSKNQFFFNLSGINAFGYFQGENGIHKDNKSEVGVCVFETPKREDVSFGEKDIKIEIFHSSGAGGQNVNKVATAVRAIHIKTGIVVVCQNERSQLQNREEALRTLKEKVEQKTNETFECENKKRRQKNSTKNIARKYDYEKGLVYKGEKSISLADFLQGNII